MTDYRIRQDDIAFLEKILLTNTPSGNEREIIRLLKEQPDICDMNTDIMGNLYLKTGSGPGKVMITAHCDEVGFQVTSIDENGFVYVRRLGGLDKHCIPGTKVVVTGSNPPICGVFGKKSPHIQTKEESGKLLELEDLWIDFGFDSKDDASDHIHIGDYITAMATPMILSNKNRIVSKGLDNKISVFILWEAMKILSKMSLDSIEVTGVVTTQEEIGCRGGIVATQIVKPDIAFCLDVGIATDIPSKLDKKCGNFRLGDGPGINRNPDNNEMLEKLLIEVADKNDIKYQQTIGFCPTGGTETARIQLLSEGVVTANISIPNRYMHSAVEMCDLSDAENCIKLIVAAIKELNNTDFSQFNLYN